LNVLCEEGDAGWSITDEMSSNQLVTLRQLDPQMKYEITVSAKSSPSSDDVISDVKIISFGQEPGKLAGVLYFFKRHLSN